MHWVNATLFGVLMLTGAALYAGPISTLVGNREVVRTLHVYSGLLLPGAVAPRRARPPRHAPAHRPRPAQPLVARRRPLVPAQPTPRRWRWASSTPARSSTPRSSPAATVVMLGTGSIMKWFDLFPLDWRTGATFVHDWFALLVWIAGARPHRVRAPRRRRARQHAQRLGPRGVGPQEGTPLVRGAAAPVLEPAHDSYSGRRGGRRRPRGPRRRAAGARSAGAHPEHQRRSRRTPPTSTRARRRWRSSARRRTGERARAARRRRAPHTSSASGRIGPTRRPCCSTRTTTCNRPGTWSGGRRSVRARASATAGCSAAAPPTTRRARSRTSPRCGRGCAPPASCPAT